MWWLLGYFLIGAIVTVAFVRLIMGKEEDTFESGSAVLTGVFLWPLFVLLSLIAGVVWLLGKLAMVGKGWTNGATD